MAVTAARFRTISMLMVGATALASSASIGSARLRGQEARPTTSVADGIYTKAQAERGRVLYDEQCASCHLQDLSGSNQAPSLAGAEFVERWNGRSVDELVDRIRTSMPADRVGSFSREQSIAVVTYMLLASDFAAGSSELSNDRTVLRQILIRLE